MASDAFCGAICSVGVDKVIEMICYAWKYEDSVESLATDLNSLDARLSTVKKDVYYYNEQQRREIREDVTLWIDSASEVVNAAKEFLVTTKKNATGCCGQGCNWKTRYEDAEEAESKSEKIKGLEAKGFGFDTVYFNGLHPKPLAKFWSTGYVAVPSMDETIEQLKKFLQDDKMTVVGIYGVKGVGKSRLAKKFAADMEKAEVFKVVVADCKDSDDKIRSQIAERVGFELATKSNPESAGRLYEKLDGMKVLIIFDNVDRKIDLREIGIPDPRSNNGCRIVVVSTTSKKCNDYMVLKTILEIKPLNQKESETFAAGYAKKFELSVSIAFISSKEAWLPSEIQQCMRNTSTRKNKWLPNIQRVINTNKALRPVTKSASQSSEDETSTIFLNADALDIPHKDNPQYWRMDRNKFSPEAVLIEVWYLNIDGNAMGMLPETNYGAYFVYQLSDNAKGFNVNPLEMIVGKTSKRCYLDPSKSSDYEPTEREDKWLEIEMGIFYSDDYTYSPMKLTVQDHDTSIAKSGLHIYGIELRQMIVIPTSGDGINTLLLNADELHISHKDNPQYWRLDRSKSSLEAVLIKGLALNIEGKAMGLFAPGTNYGAYFVYQLTDDATGFNIERVEMIVGMNSKLCYLDPSKSNTDKPTEREDKWLEIEMGTFYSDDYADSLVVDLVIKNHDRSFSKSGLRVHGIEIRQTIASSSTKESNITQAETELPSDMESKDKFLTQSFIAGSGSDPKDITPEMFNKDSSNHVEDNKLTVLYAPPQQSASPPHRGLEEDTRQGVSVKDRSLDTTECTMVSNIDVDNQDDLHKFNKDSGNLVEECKLKIINVLPQQSASLPHRGLEEDTSQGFLASKLDVVNQDDLHKVNKDSGNLVEDNKLTVLYGPPQQSASPPHRGLEEDTPHRVSVKDRSLNTTECTMASKTNVDNQDELHKLNKDSGNLVEECELTVLNVPPQQSGSAPHCGLEEDTPKEVSLNDRSGDTIECTMASKTNVDNEDDLNKFNKDSGNLVEDCKLAVTYVPPQQSASPPHLGLEEDTLQGVCVNDKILDTFEFTIASQKDVDVQDKFDEIASSSTTGSTCTLLLDPDSLDIAHKNNSKYSRFDRTKSRNASKKAEASQVMRSQTNLQINLLNPEERGKNSAEYRNERLPGDIKQAIHTEPTSTTKPTTDGQMTNSRNIIQNHDFSQGLQHWRVTGGRGDVAPSQQSNFRGPKSDGFYAVVTKRKEEWQGLEQEITSKVSPGVTYNVVACVAVSGPLSVSCVVEATLRLENHNSRNKHPRISRITVPQGQWVTVEGSFTLPVVPEKLTFYLEGPPPGVDLFIKSVEIRSSSQTTFQIASPSTSGSTSNWLHDPDSKLNRTKSRNASKKAEASQVMRSQTNLQSNLLNPEERGKNSAEYRNEGLPGDIKQAIHTGTTSTTKPTTEGKMPDSRDNLSANIIQNHDFSQGLKSWYANNKHGSVVPSHLSNFGGPKSDGFYAVVKKRTEKWHGLEQDITSKVSPGVTYNVAACVAVSVSSEVEATLRLENHNSRDKHPRISRITVPQGQWVTVEGSFTLPVVPEKLTFYLEGPPPGVDLFIKSVEIRSSSQTTFQNTSFGVNIIENSDLDNGTDAWLPHGKTVKLKVAKGSPRMLPPMAKESLGANKSLSGRYILATNRTETWMGPQQIITDKLKLFMTYQVSAWVKVGSTASGPQNVEVTLKVDDQWVYGGQVNATNDKWHEVGGSIRIEKKPSKMKVYVHGPDSGVDLMVAGFQMFAINRES